MFCFFSREWSGGVAYVSTERLTHKHNYMQQAPGHIMSHDSTSKGILLPWQTSYESVVDVHEFGVVEFPSPIYISIHIVYVQRELLLLFLEFYCIILLRWKVEVVDGRTMDRWRTYRWRAINTAASILNSSIISRVFKCCVRVTCI